MTAHHDPRGYRFGNVEVRIDRQELVVGGEVVPCQPLAFRLMVLLCEAAGQAVSRQVLFEKLWEDQVVSDESLTQLVYKLRSALGEDAQALTTVRGLGFRLDAEAQPITSPVPDPLVRSLGSEETRQPDRVPAPAGALLRRPWLLGGAAAVLALGVGTAFLLRPNPPVHEGWGLMESDLRGMRSEAARLFTLGLRADASGNRPQGIAHLEEAARLDQHSALPAAFLAQWHNYTGNSQARDNWAKAAKTRLRPTASPYESLLVRFLLEDPEDEQKALGSAILAIRPGAWMFRLNLAHRHLDRREREAALAELKTIDVRKLDDRRLALVLSDRASLGDADAAERDLRALRLPLRRTFVLYTEGRIAWSRERPDEAARLYDSAVATATIENLPDMALSCRLLGGIARVKTANLDEAQTHLDQAAAQAREVKRADVHVYSAAIGAYAAFRRGDSEGRDRRLKEAMDAERTSPNCGVAAGLHLMALWMGSSARQPLSPCESSPERLGLESLIKAREAWAEGRRADAEALLTRARTEGIAGTYQLEEATLLAADLGRPIEVLKFDPPYPHAHRFAAISELTRRDTRKLTSH